MRKTLTVFLLLFGSLSVIAQTISMKPPVEAPRGLYDPAARLGFRSVQNSKVGDALQKINPQDKDYGQAIEEARIAAIESTVEDFYWWSIVMLCLLLILSLALSCWLLRERAVRLNIAADIVAQLYNSHIGSRAKALEAIEKHNRIAARYNAISEELAAERATAVIKEQKRNRKGDAETADKLAENPPEIVSISPMNSSIGNPGERRGEVPAGRLGGESEKEIVRLNEMVRGLKAQATAQNQKISNLRGQLNRAHDQYKLQSSAEERG